MANEWTSETTDERFETDVIERSRTTPVLVDFWADWCAPCRMLAPILESAIKKREGSFVLVKAETERCQMAAGSFQVSSIPAVFLVYQGKVVDYFAGVLPESELDQWLDGHAERFRLIDAEALEESDPEQAEAIYRENLAAHPNEYPAMIALARVLCSQQKLDEARQWIEKLEKRGFLEPEAEKVKAQLELSELGGADVESLRAEAEAAPDDWPKQLELAKALMAANDYPEALAVCLRIIEGDKAGTGEEAKQLMLDVFRVWEDEDQVREFRKKLSMLLY